MRIKAKVKKMTGAEALRISLVGHAASRIPFRIVKSSKNQENGMVDLSRIFKAEAKGVPEKAAEAPSLIGVVVQKADASDELKPSLIGKGFEVDAVVENDDDTVTYVKKGEVVDDSSTILRDSDHMLLVMKGFSPYSDDMSAFADIANARGFYAGVRSASETLADTLQQAMYDAKAPADAAKTVGDTIDAYKTYILALVNGLPTLAFKMEEALEEINVDKSEDTSPNVTEDGEAKSAIVEENTEGTVAVQVAGESAGETVQKADEGTTEGVQTVAALANPSEIAVEVAKILKGELDAVQASVASLTAELQTVKDVQDSMQNSVQEVARKSETLEATLKGTVIAAPASEDQPGQTGVTKTETFVPLGDTAFSRNRNRRAQ